MMQGVHGQQVQGVHGLRGEGGGVEKSTRGALEGVHEVEEAHGGQREA